MAGKAAERIKLVENNITRFEIFPNSGGPAQNLLGKGGYHLYYYENILSPSLELQVSLVTTGSDAAANDGSGASISFMDSIKSGAGEKVYLEFEDGNKTKISFTTDDNALYLNRTEKLPESNKVAGYTFHLVTKEYFTNEQERVLERYDGKISDSVKSILKNVLKTNKQLDIEPTQNKYSFIGTNKKPIWCLNWLAKKCIPDNGNALGSTAGYFFFETKKGFKYKSIEKLFEKPKVYTKLIYNNTPSTAVPIGYDGKIIKYNTSDTGDLKEQMKLGTYTSTMNQFNSFESAYNCNPISLDLQIKGINFTGVDWGKDVNKIFSSGKPTRFSASNMSIGGFTSVDESHNTDHDKETTTCQANSRYNQVYKFEMSIEIAGDFSLEAGDVIYCDFPEKSNKKTPVPNSRLSGFYLIAAVCHHLEPQMTITSLQLVRDSYGRAPMTSGSSSGSTSSVQKASDTSPSASNNPTESKGVTQQDIDTAVNDERTLIADQERVVAQTPDNGINYDDEGYNRDLTNGDILTEEEAEAQFKFR